MNRMGNTVSDFPEFFMLRTVLLAGIALHIAAPASAQTALETASYILFGSRADKTGGNATYDGNKASIRTGFGKYTAIITQENPCKFSVQGTEFYKNVVAPIDYTVDFSSMIAGQGWQAVQRTETTSTFGPPSTLWHYLVPGVVICTKKRFPNTVLHDHPADGTCLNVLATRGHDDQTESNRQFYAIKHMSETYCKGSAF